MSAVTLHLSFFFFNDTATTEIYTLSLHDALPISILLPHRDRDRVALGVVLRHGDVHVARGYSRRYLGVDLVETDRKSTRLNSSHLVISYAVFCLKKKKTPTGASRRRRTSGWRL